MTEEISDQAATDNAPFHRLAPFIQEFIWKHGWTELREIQVRATAAVFEGDRHLLLAAGTASGKTEAAFLPILTQLYEDPPSSVGALYIGPLKALINDQFLRLGDLCVEAEIPVTAWHGDVSASRKHTLMKKPQGILQITPEALEGILLNRSADLMRVFGDLRWVVIDEVHAFMASDRGGQVLSLLDRLARYAADPQRLPRRAGLSATLGDYAEAAAWLDGASGRGVEVISDKTARTVYLLVDQFMVQSDRPDQVEADDSERSNGSDGIMAQHDGDAALADQLITLKADLFTAAYEATQKKRSLIFTNSRGDAEEIVTALRRLTERQHAPDIYYVHHGSISAALREAAETAMRDGDGPACTAATVTLELGIDLGQLDRVLQLGPTSTVASFLQRLGRAGRRGQPPEMFFLLREKESDANAHILERMPWELLQTIALIQLYHEEKWIEPLERVHLPGSLLYHQTMSVAGAAGELTPAQLAERVLTLAPFANVTEDDFRGLLRYLLEIDHLQMTEEKSLILGLAGEKVVRNFRFLATFQDSTEWAVKDQGRDIGTIASLVPQGEHFALAGRTWEVVDIIPEQRILMVKLVKGSLRTHFLGGAGGDVHDRIAERMRIALAEDTEYAYLTERAVERLAQARQVARTAGIAERPRIVELGGNQLALLPWAGSRVLRTLGLRLAQIKKIRSVQVENFYLTFASPAGEPALAVEILRQAHRQPIEPLQLIAALPRAFCQRAKYDEFLPETLLRKAFVARYIDSAGATAALRASLVP